LYRFIYLPQDPDIYDSITLENLGNETLAFIPYAKDKKFDEK
jgi:hypothetical protein